MSQTVIQVLKNGPFLVNGPIELKDSEGKMIPTKEKLCALCRCGHSHNQPFCDGAHSKAGFKA